MPAVAVLALRPHRRPAEVRGEPVEPVHRRGAEQQRVAGEVRECHGFSFVAAQCVRRWSGVLVRVSRSRAATARAAAARGSATSATRPRRRPRRRPASQRSMSRSCSATDARPGSVANLSRSTRRSSGVNCSSTVTMAALPASRDRDVVQLVVGLQRGVDVAGSQGRGESLVGGTHRTQVGTGQPAHRLEHGQPVHRGDDRHRVRRRARVDAGDHGRATRHSGDQPGLLQAQQRLADGGAAHAEPGGQLEVAQLLAGLEGAVDDRVAQPLVDVVAEQHALAGDDLLGNRHAIYRHTAERPRQGRGRGGSVAPRAQVGSRGRNRTCVVPAFKVRSPLPAEQPGKVGTAPG